MNGRRELTIAAFLCWLLASLASASVAHAFIDVLSRAGLGGAAYAEHEHGAVGPVALAFLVLSVTGLLGFLVRAIGRESTEPLMRFARNSAEASPLVAGLGVTLGALGTLLCMEFVEQYAAFGHVEGVSDALGGNVFAGFFAILSVAFLVTIAARRSLHGLFGAAFAVAFALVAWVGRRSRSASPCALAARPNRSRAPRPAVVFSRALGLRAPPGTLA